MGARTGTRSLITLEGSQLRAGQRWPGQHVHGSLITLEGSQPQLADEGQDLTAGRSSPCRDHLPDSAPGASGGIAPLELASLRGHHPRAQFLTAATSGALALLRLLCAEQRAEGGCRSPGQCTSLHCLTLSSYGLASLHRSGRRRHDLRHTGLTWPTAAFLYTSYRRHGRLTVAQGHLHQNHRSITEVGEVLSLHLRRPPSGPQRWTVRPRPLRWRIQDQLGCSRQIRPRGDGSDLPRSRSGGRSHSVSRSESEEAGSE